MRVFIFDKFCGLSLHHRHCSLLAVRVYVTARRPSVCLSVPSIDSGSDVRATGLPQLGRGRQIPIDIYHSGQRYARDVRINTDL